MSNQENSTKIPFAPILHPSTKEFSNFNEYVEKLEAKYSKNYGMVKIVAPKSWVPRTKDYDKSIERDIIPQPIEQNVQGKAGIYELLHIVQKSISLKEYKKKTQPQDHFTEGKSVEEVEQLFYKNISFSPPIYGADARNTLFDKGCKWNLGELDCLLNLGLKTVISGVNESFLYTGAWKTMFCWHKEDMDLGAINYLHTGKPKFWYAIAASDQHYLETLSQQHFADNFNKCSEYLRHKTTLINPYLLAKKYPQIKMTKMIQNPREFIIVFGGSYHHGFNFGFNIAEAVNYGTKSWLKVFPKAKSCKCLNDQVKINHQEFYDNLVLYHPEMKQDPSVKKFLSEIKERGLYMKQKKEENIQEEEQQTKGKKKDVHTAQQIKIKQQVQQVIQQERQVRDQISKRLSAKMFGRQNYNKQRISKKVKQLQEEEDQNKKKTEKQSKKQIKEPMKIIKKTIKKQKKENKAQQDKQPGSKSVSKRQNKIKINDQQMEVESQQQESQSNSSDTQQKRKRNQSNQNRNNAIKQLCNKKLEANLENWQQCDNCSKYRKIQDRSIENKIQKKKSFYCKDIQIKCTIEQDTMSLHNDLN